MKPQTRTWHLTASTSLGFCSSVSTSQIKDPAVNLKPSGLLAGFYSMRNIEFHVGFGARKKRKIPPPKKRNSWARACFRARCTRSTRIRAEMEKEKLASGLALKIREHTMLNPWSCHSLKWTEMQSSPSCAVSSAIGVEFLPLWFHLRHNLRHHRKSSDASCFGGWFSRPSP